MDYLYKCSKLPDKWQTMQTLIRQRILVYTICSVKLSDYLVLWKV